MARRSLPKKVRVRLHPLGAAALGALLLSVVLSLGAQPGAEVLPSAPQALAQWSGATPLPAGARIDRSSLVLSFSAGAGSVAAVPEVEVAPAGRPFAGAISEVGSMLAAHGRAQVVRVAVRGLRNGVAYRWRARLRGVDRRAGPWSVFGPASAGRAAAFVVDITPPPAPSLASSTHPDPSVWYASTLASLSWSVPPDHNGIAGYAYTLDRDASGVPAPHVMTTGTAIEVAIPGDGQWYAHVRAVDTAGNWGAAATLPIRVDRHPTAFGNVAFGAYSFDPDIEREDVALSLVNVADVRASIIDELTGTVVRRIDMGTVSGDVTLSWNGRTDAGKPAPAGLYRFLLTATDPYGQQSVADYSGIRVVRRRIVVSLSRQNMVVYDGAQRVTSSLVTTGNRALPTPLGTFHIIEKLQGFTFISPWPKGSPYYYAPSHVQYALLFNWNGYYIHDAPWRTFYGPGSNAQLGTPGQNLTGTHGCVNVPESVAAFLYAWAPVGTVVQVVP